jgi:hypothetical protein
MVKTAFLVSGVGYPAGYISLIDDGIIASFRIAGALRFSGNKPGRSHSHLWCFPSDFRLLARPTSG